MQETSKIECLVLLTQEGKLSFEKNMRLVKNCILAIVSLVLTLVITIS